MVEKTQTKVGLKFEFPTSMPKPNPVHLSFSEGNFGSCISSNSCAFCLTPNADCIERTRDMSSTNWFINSSIEPHSPTWIPSTPIRAYIEAWALELLANARKELCHMRLGSGRTWLGLCYAIGFWKFCFPLMVLWGREKW